MQIYNLKKESRIGRKTKCIVWKEKSTKKLNITSKSYTEREIIIVKERGIFKERNTLHWNNGKVP